VSAGVPFDRAVAFYDRTRSLPPEVSSAVARLLAGELEGRGRALEGRGRALEVGAGSGRITLPLAARGIPLAAVDLSRPMLEQLQRNAGGRAPFPVAVADGLALPFPSGAFGASLTCHVLHLVAGWQGFLAEVVRVVRPGGVVLFDLGSEPPEIQETKERFAREAGLERVYVGMRDPVVLDRAMAGLGASARLLEPIRFETRQRIRDVLRGYAGAQFSFTWVVEDEAVLRRAARATRAWAAGRFGDPDEQRTFVRTIQWRAYDLPGAAGA